jgi:hypothetical protein
LAGLILLITVEFFQALFGGWHWMISGAILLWLVLAFATPFGRIWKNETDRKRVVGFLMQNRGKTRYARVMRRLLDWIDNTLSAPEQAAGLPPWRIA